MTYVVLIVWTMAGGMVQITVPDMEMCRTVSQKIANENNMRSNLQSRCVEIIP